jgi:hypothetical protein
VKNLRRFALASVIVGAVIGAFAKFATGSFIPNDNYVVDFSKLPEKIGSFVIQEEMNRDRSLQLRSAQCEGSIFLTAYSIKEPPPEAFSALLYPSDKWRTLYVYRGQTYETFARIPAYLRLVALRAIEALTMSARDLSDEYLFSFHIPTECAVDFRAAVAASNVILDLAAPLSH